MSVTDSETVGLRLQVADTVLTTLCAYSDDVADGYHRFLLPTPSEDDAPIFDARGQIALLRQRVVHGRERLVDVHADVVGHLRGSDDVSHEVATLTTALTERFRAARHTLKGLFRAHSLALLGVAGRIPETPWRLVRKVRFVQAGLRDPELVMDGVLRMPKGGLTPAMIADQLEDETHALGQALEARRLGGRETVAGRSERAAAVKDFDREVRLVIRLFAAMARAAGRDDLAAQIAPIFRRATRRAKRTRTQEIPVLEAPVSSETPPAPQFQSRRGQDDRIVIDDLRSPETPSGDLQGAAPVDQTFAEAFGAERRLGRREDDPVRVEADPLVDPGLPGRPAVSSIVIDDLRSPGTPPNNMATDNPV